jgi:hypothetical protein
MQKVKDTRLSIGMKVRTNANGDRCISGKKVLEGVIGHIADGRFCVWHDDRHFRGGNLNVCPVGYRYSWIIRLDNDDAWIEIINEKIFHPKIKNTFKNL